MTLPIESGALVVNTTPLQIDGVGVSPIRLYIHNEDGTNNLHIGNSTVTPTTGFALLPNSIQDFLIFPGQSLFVVSSQGNHDVSWLRIPV